MKVVAWVLRTGHGTKFHDGPNPPDCMIPEAWTPLSDSPPLAPERAVRELLAVIHRDGGHYLAEHGLKKAAEDGLTEVIRIKNELAALAPEPFLSEADRERIVLLMIAVTTVTPEFKGSETEALLNRILKMPLAPAPAEDRRDAERYRHGLDSGLLRLTGLPEHVHERNARPWADERIDAAMQADKEKGK